MAKPEDRLEFVEDLEPAAWLGDDSKPFGWNVGAVIPPGFEAYGRVFHPAALAGEPVSWSEIATANGKVLHPEAQFESITGVDPWRGNQPGLWDSPPRIHDASDIVRPLLQVLLAQTSTPDRGWFCVWEGWGGMTRPSFEARVRRPMRAYWLMHGPLVAVVDGFGAFGAQGPSIWWPDDRAWCVATEIDYRWTYVGGTGQLIDDLIADPDLEVLPSTLTDRVGITGDLINAPTQSD
jgi:hypothetical protein